MIPLNYKRKEGRNNSPPLNLLYNDKLKKITFTLMFSAVKTKWSISTLMTSAVKTESRQI